MVFNSFENTYNPKDNAIGFTRLILAVFVVVQHSFALQNLTDPLTNLNLTSFGSLGVNSFFILSGFLITSSWLNSKSIVNYIWRRVIRIFPALWVCLLFTATIIAPTMIIIAQKPLSIFFLKQQALYIVNNLFLIINQPDIDNLTKSLPQKSLNGSLWTLSWEFLAYLCLALAGVAGFLKKRKWILIVFILAYTFCYWIDPCKCTILLKFYTSSSIAILPYFFLVGTLTCLYISFIPDSKFLFILAILFWLLDLKFNTNYPLHPFFLSYILLWLITHLPFKSIEKIGDFSYGIYIYHFAIIQLLLLYYTSSLNPWIIFFITTPIAVLLAYLSWHYVEKKCLQSKNRFK